MQSQIKRIDEYSSLRNMTACGLVKNLVIPAQLTASIWALQTLRKHRHLFADQQDFRKDSDLQDSCKNLNSAYGKMVMSWEQVGISNEAFLFRFIIVQRC